MNNTPNTQPPAPKQPNKWAPKSEADWDLGLTIIEELVRLNGLHGEPVSRECIADVMEISPQAVENLEKRAMQKLRRLTSHFRPELEDAGVVQRLNAPGFGNVKGRKSQGHSFGLSNGKVTKAPKKSSGLNPHCRTRESLAFGPFARVTQSFNTV